MSTCSVSQKPFGTTRDGIAVDRFTLTNGRGMTARLLTYGTVVSDLVVPDRKGRAADVVLGFDNLAQYETQSPYFGCTVGRVAFRTAGASFVMNGREYSLTKNNGIHHLHGGTRGFSHLVWQAEPIQAADAAGVRFRHRSPDGDQGYPGNLEVSVTFTLNSANELRIEYEARTDQTTPVNLTNHSYFNLAGAGCGTVLGHELQLPAARYSKAGPGQIPSGELPPVAGTPLDFSKPTAIGARIEQIGGGLGGYDFAYLQRPERGELIRMAMLHEPSGGRTMEVLSTEPAIIFYTGNALPDLVGKEGRHYGRHSGLCLETGCLPDSLHHPNFPSIILTPQETYRQTCVYRFSWA